MAEIIKGVAVAADIRKSIAERLEKFTDRKPCLAMIRIGNNPSDLSYQGGVSKTIGNLGIDYRVVELPEDIEQTEFEKRFCEVNEDESIDGILLFRPIPKHLDQDRINNLIDPRKDIDCMSPVNVAKMAMGDNTGFYPCTPEAVLAMLDYAGIDCRGKKAVLIGRSAVVGRPLGYMLLTRNATVTWCHSYTKDVAATCREADIIVSAVGRAGFVTEKHVEEAARDCIVVDVGINAKPDGSPGICGDVAFEEVEPYVGMITPVPGGVGAVTSTILAEHVVRAAGLKLL